MTGFDPTTIQIPFGMLTPKEQAALKEWPHGWQVFSVDGWRDKPDPAWLPHFAHRGKPAPVVKEYFVNVYPNSLGNAHPSKHEAENEWPWGGAVAGMIRVEIVDGKLKDVRLVDGDDV